MSTSSVNATLFRQALSQFATGVAVITTCTAEGQKIGITANSFSSLSLDPPLILWCLSEKSSSLPIFQTQSHYVINILNHSQLALCEHFASYKGDRFENLSHPESHTGLPIMNDALAWLECRHQNHYQEGDHTIFVGRVEYCDITTYTDLKPLIFFDRQFHTIK